jgi:hypothetical protein
VQRSGAIGLGEIIFSLLYGKTLQIGISDRIFSELL